MKTILISPGRAAGRTDHVRFSARHVEPFLKRAKPKTNWKGMCLLLVWIGIGAAALMAYTIAVMIFTTIMIQKWEPERFSFAFPIVHNGKKTELGVICARAASDGTLSGDLLTYCN